MGIDNTRLRRIDFCRGGVCGRIGKVVLGIAVLGWHINSESKFLWGEATWSFKWQAFTREIVSYFEGVKSVVPVTYLSHQNEEKADKARKANSESPVFIKVFAKSVKNPVKQKDF
jgi:hypothetical protein